MRHFDMDCRKPAGRPHAQVNQCYLCHQTTAWNDIKGGWAGTSIAEGRQEIEWSCGPTVPRFSKLHMR